jgi:hypothetical protein
MWHGVGGVNRQLPVGISINMLFILVKRIRSMSLGGDIA